MNDKFNEQKDTLVSLKHEISLLQQQVDYLLRNEKSLGLLDLDVMMNRTHSIYDQLCSIDISDMPMEEEIEDRSQETEDIPMEPEEEEAIKALFGIEEEPVQEEETIPEEDNVIENETEPSTPDDDGLLRYARNDEPEKPVVEPEEEPVVEPEEEPVVEPKEEPVVEPEEEPINVVGNVEDAPQSDPNDFGFILNFEPVEEPVYTTGDEIEMSIPQVEIPQEETPVPDGHEEEIPYEPVIIGDMEEKEESGFELEAQETLGDRLQQQEDHSLAAKLQHEAAVKDLRTAIGINDKFLLVNELFSGSMEKYNKSIENLNDLKTLNGALIYMNELRIELQWNSSNEAYKKLLELVHRKYEA
jgi:hypothetical protein